MHIIENRMKFFAVSLVVIFIGLGSMVYHNSIGNGFLNWDIEFTGGTSIEIDMGEVYDVEALRDVITEITGQKNVQVQELLNSNEVVIKMQSIASYVRSDLMAEIETIFKNAEIVGSADVSGTVSQQMQTTAIKAILIACVAMLIYISFRFRDIRAGGSAILALLHDVLIVLAAYGILRIPVDNSFIAVLLTILGYSVNATIVIFDRIRENGEEFLADEVAEKMNKSIAQTLARSIHTSATTLLAVGAIYVLGVQSIKEFALPMMVGIIAGMYSSIFISSSIWYTLLPKYKEDVQLNEE